MCHGNQTLQYVCFTEICNLSNTHVLLSIMDHCKDLCVDQYVALWHYAFIILKMINEVHLGIWLNVRTV